MAGGGFEFNGKLLSEVLPPGETLIRIHQSDRSPLWFGPAPGVAPGGRFEAPDGQYRTLYAAFDLTGAFVETVLHRPAGRIVRRAYLEARSFSTFHSRRPLTLAKLHGPGLLHHQAPPAISAGLDYPTSRAFALALFEQFPQVDGLAYRSSHNDDERCVALFDRVALDDLEIEQTTKLSDAPDLVDAIMAKHGAAYDTSAPIPSLKTLLEGERDYRSEALF